MTDKLLTFVETPIFSEDRARLLSDDEYQKFQADMLENYHLGDVITQTNGCRKIRWRLENNNRGKSSGVRIIYYTLIEKEKLYLMLIYSKNRKDDMSSLEKNMLRNVVEQITKE